MIATYSFQKQFIEPILAGTKRQTIRAVGKRRHALPGDTLHLYFGQRTKHCRLIAKATCERVEQVYIDFTGYGVIKHGMAVLFSDEEMQRFARRDGFISFEQMREFWRKHHPDVDVFNGVLIQWEGLRA